MLQISIFLGIIIKMYYREHNPPHFHAHYSEHSVIIDIQKLEVGWLFATTSIRAGNSMGCNSSD